MQVACTTGPMGEHSCSKVLNFIPCLLAGNIYLELG